MTNYRKSSCKISDIIIFLQFPYFYMTKEHHHVQYCSMGKLGKLTSFSTGPFSMAMLNYQEVIK